MKNFYCSENLICTDGNNISSFEVRDRWNATWKLQCVIETFEEKNETVWFFLS